MKLKKILSIMTASVLLMSTLSGCGAQNTDASNASSDSNVTVTAAPTSAPTTAPTEAPVEEDNVPKYVFLFIGDGMTYSQFQVASSYLGALEETDDILDGNVSLNFMQFPVAGSATTYDSSSFCPDSASTATSIASGHKTYSGVINMDETLTEKFVTITEQLRDQKDYKIGIISSVNLNHATPAAFYAHQASRGSYYDIGLELIASDYDYFAGGGLLKPDGHDKENPSENLYELAKEAGYNVVMTQAEAEALTSQDGKTIIIGETLADSNSLSYEVDRAEGEWSLADYVEKGIEMLDNETGFFMMCEGGKVDWACHANDAGSTIHDVLALDDAVAVAMEFAAQHPDETLILVTGDHETGGLTIGFAGTDYDTYLDNIQNQKISYAKYDADYVAGYVENNTDFATAMADVEELFGLVMPENAANAADETLVLTDYEVSELKKAYDYTINGFAKDEEGNTVQSQSEYVDYGTYTPFSVTVTHLLNNKSGINFSSYSHTGLPAAVFADGVGAESFVGSYDNTDIYKKLAALLEIAQ